MSNKTISRRTFLKTGCITVAAAGLTLCGAGLVIPTPDPTAIKTPSFNYGGENMDKQILVAYASGLGSTIDVADVIGKALSASGISVDIKPIQENLKIDGYQAVIIGSAVRYAEWLPEAVSFVHIHQDHLNSLPVALFCVHITNQGNDKKSRGTV